MSLRRVVVGGLLWLIALPVEARQWTDSSGVFTVEAELVEVMGTAVRLKKPTGEIIRVPIERLCQADQQYLRSLSAKKPGVKPGPAVWGEAAVEAALTQPARFEFIETPLTDVLAFLSDAHDLTVFLDRRALEEIGIATDTPLTAKSRGGDLAANLDALLAPLELTWLVHCDVLLVTTKEQAESLLKVRVYKLLRPLDTGKLVDDVTQNVAPQSWDAVGGPGSLGTLGSSVLVVSQPAAGHREIRQHYHDLLAPIHAAEPTAKPTGDTGMPAALDERTRLEFIDTPLDQVAESLHDRHQVDVTLDGKALEEIGVERTAPLTVNLKNLRLRSALSLIVGQLGLAWTADKHSIRITSPERADGQLDLVSYRVDDVLPAVPMDQLITVISATVSPQTWDAVGGPGTIRHGIRGTLDVRQTFAVHQQIVGLLADLRQALQKPAGGGR